MSALPTVFISYAHEGADRGTLKAFENLLHQASNGELEVLVDDRLEIGDQISKHIARLATCDAAVVLLTPEYLARIEGRKGGVYEEYRLIKHRLDARAETSPEKPDHFLVFPILFSGTKEQSCPRDLTDHLFGNMVYFRANETERGEVVVSQQTRKQHEALFKQMSGNVLAAGIMKLKAFRDEYARKYDSLFVETKAERMRHRLSPEQWRQIIVSTRAFSLTLRQQSLLLVGRKGSGKSTIVQHLFDENPHKYKDRIHVDLEKFSLQPLFDLVYSQQVRSEIKSIYEPVGFFRCVWSLFLFFACVLTLQNEKKKGLLSPEQSKLSTMVLAYAETSLSNVATSRGQTDYFLLFSYCVEVVATDLKKNIDTSLRDKKTDSITKVIANIREEETIQRIVGQKVFDSFVSVVRKCARRFLFSLDGFDTKFDEFRRSTIASFQSDPDQAEERTQFEIDWLRGLFHTIIKLRDEFFEPGIADKIDFCVTVPKDRYMEARKADRDGFIYDDRRSYLDWRARELFLMIRKRLDVMNDFYHKDGDAVERLWRVIGKFYPALPRRIGIEHNGKSYEMELEKYVLRHTFWRPRDMLKYYAKILAFHDLSRKRHRAVDDVAIRFCIAETTSEIVETEFLNEFRGICYNLEEIIGRFRKRPQLLKYSDLYGIIDGADFQHANESYKPRTFRQKFEFLYQIGFLGVKLVKEWAEDWRVSTDEVFYFSDGDTLVNSLNDDELRLAKFIVHPIFCEKLRLNTKGADLALMYTDGYIDRNDSL